MYQFVDQPITRLEQGSQFLLAAMRAWEWSALDHRCPKIGLSVSFAQIGLLQALGDFHELMMMLGITSSGQRSFAANRHAPVNEGEAILLAVWSDVAARNYDRPQMVLGALYNASTAQRAVLLTQQVSAQMALIGLFPDAPLENSLTSRTER
ncbi:hypothetical protein [Altericroceibacterium endophyticum]|uniref:Uncharacterized protein n=1 Tax=Altericroceibacterium endophyticum TaxID=1808508 RepID=A0A6I4T132_9SPHN|nr:hypothetical protein [Altericroceibacterium endophyticum]MXO64588.1 hypothetical protein [Altericroceibacterium endophyticum]